MSVGVYQAFAYILLSLKVGIADTSYMFSIRGIMHALL